jgi:hypothetical protein
MVLHVAGHAAYTTAASQRPGSACNLYYRFVVHGNMLYISVVCIAVWPGSCAQAVTALLRYHII